MCPCTQLTQRFASKLARLCYYARFTRYKSCCSHQKKTIRKGCLFSCGSGLETKLRFVGKRHCVCLPLHAADAPLGNNIALLALLRSFYSLQVLLSAPKQTKTNRIISVRFFISLVCNRTCDNAGHCLHTPCAPARCAAGASLPRINSPVPLLRSLRSLQVLLSAPKKDNPKGLSFFMRQRT